MPDAETHLLVYDGRCGFCKLWIDYWHELTGDRVRYEPSDTLERSVELHLAGGEVLTGARAVFTALKEAPAKAWLERAYYGVPGFVAVSELAYRIIAAHRTLAWHATVLLFGNPIRPKSYDIVCRVFEKILAAIYIIAFWTFAVQARGLIGSRGILPIERYLEAVHAQVGRSALWMAPTVWWFNASDTALIVIPILGIAAACLVLAGVARRISLAAAFILYLSICTGGQDFYSFQWDLLLLEAGFLAIFLGSMPTIWLYRSLVFRLMFSSGAVKLLSGDPTWRNLTALSFHYHTQPLPTPLAWYADKLPMLFQKASTAMTLAVELGVPFLVFLPRRARHFAAFWLIGLQVLIAATGNFAFFNLLTIALCLFLFDDSDLRRLVPKRIGPWFDRLRAGAVPKPILACVVILVLVLSIVQMIATLTGRIAQIAEPLLRVAEPFGIVNRYGLFADMTTSRPEIIVQRSDDGQTWTDYQFRYKPGALTRAPGWVAPYQPRLDWQMWFAALGSWQNNPWFVNFMFRLLEGSPDVLKLMAPVRGDTSRPRFVRALVFDYSFATSTARRATGDWWQREPRGEYLRPISPEDLRQAGRSDQRSAVSFQPTAQGAEERPNAER